MILFYSISANQLIQNIIYNDTALKEKEIYGNKQHIYSKRK